MLLESITGAPPVGAAPVSVTVPSDVLPPLTLAGFKVSDESVVVDPALPIFTTKASS